MKSNTRVVMIEVFLGLFLAELDQTIAATALPTIVADLHDHPLSSPD